MQYNNQIKETLNDFINWVDNNTYTLDGEMRRRWQNDIYGKFTELATTDKLIEYYLDNKIKSIEYKTFNEAPYSDDNN